jgi:hypothetical protein
MATVEQRLEGMTRKVAELALARHDKSMLEAQQLAQRANEQLSLDTREIRKELKVPDTAQLRLDPAPDGDGVIARWDPDQVKPPAAPSPTGAMPAKKAGVRMKRARPGRAARRAGKVVGKIEAKAPAGAAEAKPAKVPAKQKPPKE